MNARQVWQATLTELQGQVSRANFETWLRNTRVVSTEGDRFVVSVPNSFAREWLEGRFRSQLERTLSRMTGHPTELQIVVAAPGGRKKTTEAPAPSAEPDVAPEPPREASPSQPAPVAPHQRDQWEWTPNPRYTFERFVEGPSNRLALAASQAAARAPASIYNPLFLYGGTGVGKTHLMHAIAHVTMAAGLKVLYAPADQFLNELVAAITERRTDEFRQRYRRIHVLLLDDIEFIAGKERTQEEFFHTFNALYEAGSHIVLTSDRPPRAIATLEDRLRSRFEGGLVADIQPPELETRMAILRARLANEDAPVDNAVLQVIAQRIQSNIRELEGALTRVLACAKVEGRPVTVELANRALDDLTVHPTRRYITPNIVLQAVARHYGLDSKALSGKRRSKDVVGPRQVAMYLLRDEAGCNLSEVGRELGNRNHSTVIYGCERIKANIETDGQLRRDVLAIKELIYSLAKP
ncbi:MAG: chromosomal replication initiator protein DnaA [Actinobacteria bacterium]|nr:chromosomal replication initiator protein DnaA [Actinomycetota bacterium]MCL5025727.1 chromosomal replication initiator protein DnaA [Chloroflexota bacterium]